jgi:hypothetical protein
VGDNRGSGEEGSDKDVLEHREKKVLVKKTWAGAIDCSETK